MTSQVSAERLLNTTIAIEPADEPKEEIRLDWRETNAFVADPEKAEAQPKWRRARSVPLKQVLRSSWGVANPGEMLAVMGPSGSGKTTLLNLLAGRPSLGDKGQWEGKVLLNGTTPPPNWERSIGYCMQKDIFYEELTVEEHLSCTALLRLPPHWSRDAKLGEMNRLVDRLKLGGALHTRVGSATERGLSGGELKRLNIATELLCRAQASRTCADRGSSAGTGPGGLGLSRAPSQRRTGAASKAPSVAPGRAPVPLAPHLAEAPCPRTEPRLFFLDEPFTGLDSTMAARTLATLRELTSEGRCNIVLTVHQPSSAMWEAFDRLLLLAPGGYTTYLGPAGAAVAHMAELGHACPSQWNPPDFLIELVSPDEAAPDPAAFEARRDALAAAFAATPPPPPPPPTRLAIRSWPSLWQCTKPLTVRTWRRSLRAYLKPLEWALVLCLAVVFGLLWWQVGTQVATRPQDFVSIIFFFIAQWSWGPMFNILNTFPSERDVLTRERASGSYPVAAFYAARVLVELPLSCIMPVGFFAVCYPMAGLNTAQLPTLFGITILNIEVSNSWGSVISISLFDRQKATVVAIVFMCFVMCSAGYFVDMQKLPQPLPNIRYVSYWYYTMGLWTAYATPEELREDPELQRALERFSFSRWAWEGNPWADVGVLIGMAMALRCTAYTVLRLSKKLLFS